MTRAKSTPSTLTPQSIIPVRNPHFEELFYQRIRRVLTEKMFALGVCVEWTFSNIITLFAFLDYKKNQKLNLQPVGKSYRVATILTNYHTILYGSETGSFFDISLPFLPEFIPEFKRIPFFHPEKEVFMNISYRCISFNWSTLIS